MIRHFMVHATTIFYSTVHHISVTTNRMSFDSYTIYIIVYMYVYNCKYNTHVIINLIALFCCYFNAVIFAQQQVVISWNLSRTKIIYNRKSCSKIIELNNYNVGILTKLTKYIFDYCCYRNFSITFTAKVRCVSFLKFHWHILIKISINIKNIWMKFR